MAASSPRNGCASVASYTFGSFDFGEMIRCSSAPSSVISSRPLVSRSRRPTVDSCGERCAKRGGSRSYTRRPRSFVEQVWPVGLYSRSEEHTSELQSLMRISYAFLCLKNKKIYTQNYIYINNQKQQ